jgi:histidinol-phosphate aminotransferase
VRRVAPYVPGEQPGPDQRVIKLNTNENPYPPSPRVRAALAQAGDERVRLYPDPGARRLRERAAALYDVPLDHILAGNGSDELLALLLRATIDPGDRVAFPVPTYSLYETLVAVQGGEPVRIPFGDDFTLPPALADAGARLTLLCNPNSPSGTLVARAEVEALARAVTGILVVDEAYVDFAREHALALVGRHANVIVVRTLSKSFSLAGLRVGLAFGHPELLAGLQKVKDSYNLSRLSQAAGEAALEDVAWMRANVARIHATRDTLSKRLRELGFHVLPSDANFVLARRPRMDLAPVAQALAARGILVRHFGVPALQDALRITVGTDEETAALLEALTTILRSRR